jgi:hypothetical protein
LVGANGKRDLRAELADPKGVPRVVSGRFVIQMLAHLLRKVQLLDIIEHPNPERYAGQRIFVIRREDYVYLVPFVEDEHTVFLKTIIPSRKATKQYLGEESDDED